MDVGATASLQRLKGACTLADMHVAVTLASVLLQGRIVGHCLNGYLSSPFQARGKAPGATLSVGVSLLPLLQAHL